MNHSLAVLLICQWWLGIVLAAGGAFREGLLRKFFTKRPSPGRSSKANASKFFVTGFAWMFATAVVSALKVPALPVLTVYLWMKNLIYAYEAVAYGETYPSDSASR